MNPKLIIVYFIKAFLEIFYDLKSSRCSLISGKLKISSTVHTFRNGKKISTKK